MPDKPVEVLICRSNPVAPDPRVEKCAQALASAGYAVHILGWDRSCDHPSREIKNGIPIERIPIRAKFGSGTRNLFALLRWQLALSVWIARRHRTVQIIHACDFDTVVPAVIAKKLWGIQVVYDIFDFYADHIRSNRWIKRLIRAVDRRIIARVDAVILVDAARRIQIENCPVKRLEIIYNSPPDLLHTVSAPASKTGFQIGYVGMMLQDRGLIELFQVLKRHPDWSLELAGFGGDEDQIRAAAASLPNVHWHGKIEYRQSLELYAQADVILATYDPAIANNRLGSPNKIFEAMMLAKPVIVAEGTNMDRIVQEANSGLVIRYGSLEQLESALQKLCEDPDLAKKMGGSGRQAYESQYGWPKMEERLIDLYQAVSESPKVQA
jgi:glycosyltransferase involved in cell wall biosynthesis